MIFSDRDIEKTHKAVIENPKKRGWMYRELDGELTAGCTKSTVNGLTWEGKIFMGMDLVEAMKGGWQNDFYVPEPVEAPVEKTIDIPESPKVEEETPKPSTILNPGKSRKSTRKRNVL